MDTLEYLAISAGVALLAIALVRAVVRAPKEEKPPADTGRWKTFRVRLGQVHAREPTDGKPLVEEEPRGLKLHLPEWAQSGRRWQIEDADAKPRITIRRGRLLARRRLQVDVDGRHLLCFSPPRRGKKLPAISFAKPTDKCEIQGDPQRREYEVRRNARLVAIVSRQGAAGGAGPKLDCVVETLKGEEPLPLLGLLLGLEVALGPPPEEAAAAPVPPAPAAAPPISSAPRR